MGLQIQVKVSHRTFPTVQWLRFCVSNARGHEFDLLLEELRSHMPRGTAEKFIKITEFISMKILSNESNSIILKG